MEDVGGEHQEEGGAQEEHGPAVESLQERQSEDVEADVPAEERIHRVEGLRVQEAEDRLPLRSRLHGCEEAKDQRPGEQEFPHQRLDHQAAGQPERIL